MCATMLSQYFVSQDISARFTSKLVKFLKVARRCSRFKNGYRRTGIPLRGVASPEAKPYHQQVPQCFTLFHVHSAEFLNILSDHIIVSIMLSQYIAYYIIVFVMLFRYIASYIIVYLIPSIMLF